MSDLFLLSQAQMRRIAPYFPLSHGIPRVDDRRVISGIIFVIKNGLRWRDAPKDYGPHKTIYNRFIRWSELGVFNRIFAELAGKGAKPDRLMIDATHLKAHRTAASLLKKGLLPDASGARRAACAANFLDHRQQRGGTAIGIRLDGGNRSIVPELSEMVGTARVAQSENRVASRPPM